MSTYLITGTITPNI